MGTLCCRITGEVSYGSFSVVLAETCYATIELEMLAAVLYLKGLHHFEHVMDQRLLIPILNTYTVDAVENLWLQCLKEKLLP